MLHLEARIDELRRTLADLESQAEAACEAVDAEEHELAESGDEVESALAELESARRTLAELD